MRTSRFPYRTAAVIFSLVTFISSLMAVSRPLANAQKDETPSESPPRAAPVANRWLISLATLIFLLKDQMGGLLLKLDRSTVAADEFLFLHADAGRVDRDHLSGDGLCEKQNPAASPNDALCVFDGARISRRDDRQVRSPSFGQAGPPPPRHCLSPDGAPMRLPIPWRSPAGFPENPAR